MKTSIPFLFVCIASLSGCAVNTSDVDDADAITDVTDSPEPVAEAAEASTLYGVNVTPNCFAGPPGWPTSVQAWLEVYGAFDNNGNNVTAQVVATFSDGDPPLSLSYTGSNYRSGSQVNLSYSGTNGYGGCPTRYQGWVFDNGALIGTF